MDRFRLGPFLLILAVAAFCYGVQLDGPNAYRIDEPFYMVGGLTMVETGEWLIPTFQGRVRLQKPPLYYWAVATSYKIFGIGPAQARLPSVLAGIGTVVLTYILGLLLFTSHRTALYAMSAFVCSSTFMAHARWAMTDALLTFFIAAAFCGFAYSTRVDKRYLAYLAWIFVGLATLVKGPVGFAIPVLTIIVWMFVGGRAQGIEWSQVFPPIGIALFLALVLPWPMLVVARLGLLNVNTAVGSEVGYHLLAGMAHFFKALAYYAFFLLKSVFPWSVLLLLYWRRLAWTPGVRLLGLWSIGVALTFGLAINQLKARYLVPVMPPLAVLAGHALAQLEATPALWPAMQRLLPRIVAGMLAVAAAIGGLMLAAGVLIVRSDAAIVVSSLVVGMALVSMIILRRMRNRDSAKDWTVVSSACLATLVLMIGFLWDEACRHNAAYDISRRHFSAAEVESVQCVGLNSFEVSWVTMGAGKLLPNCRVAGRVTDWDPSATTRYLLIAESRLATMPARARERYTEVGRGRGTDDTPRLGWLSYGLVTASKRWHADDRPLVLLRK